MEINSFYKIFRGLLLHRTPFFSLLTLVFVFQGVVVSCGPAQPNRKAAQQIVQTLNDAYFFDHRIWRQNLAVDIKDKLVWLSGETFYAPAVQEAVKQLRQAGFPSVNIDKVVILPEKMPDGKNFGIVIQHHSMGRFKPVLKKEAATELLYGDLVRIVRSRAGFFQVQAPEGYLVYIPNNSLRRLDTLSWDKYHQGPYVKFQQNLLLPEGVEISMGTRLPYLGDGVVRLASGESMKLDSSVDYRIYSPKNNFVRKQIILSAEKYLGLPYIWAGKSGEGTDCSGFVQSVYALNGIYLPRDTDELSLVGQFIALPGWYSALQPGDLVFFTSGKRLITHVGIYYGGGKVIHAQGKNVHIDSLLPGTPGFKRHLIQSFVFAKRIID